MERELNVSTEISDAGRCTSHKTRHTNYEYFALAHDTERRGVPDALPYAQEAQGAALHTVSFTAARVWTSSVISSTRVGKRNPGIYRYLTTCNVCGGLRVIHIRTTRHGAYCTLLAKGDTRFNVYGGQSWSGL